MAAPSLAPDVDRQQLGDWVDRKRAELGKFDHERLMDLITRLAEGYQAVEPVQDPHYWLS